MYVNGSKYQSEYDRCLERLTLRCLVRCLIFVDYCIEVLLLICF